MRDPEDSVMVPGRDYCDYCESCGASGDDPCTCEALGLDAPQTAQDAAGAPQQLAGRSTHAREA